MDNTQHTLGGLLYQAALYALRQQKKPCELVVYQAQVHPLLLELQQHVATLQCIQAFKPMADMLQAKGVNSVWQADESPVDMVLIFAAKNKQQNKAIMAEAMLRLHDGGQLLMVCANMYGAKSYQALLAVLAGDVLVRSKAKCRVLMAKKNHAFDMQQALEWQQEGQATRQLDSHGLYAMPGLFSWDREDTGSQMLIDAVLADKAALSGHGMDVCCGYGLLSVAMLRAFSAIDKLDMLDADAFALDCAEKNTAAWRQKTILHWQDAASKLPTSVDWIVCNPPFHTGQIQDIALGQDIVACACRSLRRGGTIYLVANQKLPYERIMREQLAALDCVRQEQGFKVLRGRR